jgi:hypothetical protein
VPALGVVLLACAQLAYISSTVTTSVLLLCVALVLAAGGEGGRERARALVIILALGSLLSVVLYYRDFLAGTFEAVRAALGSAEATRPHRPGPGRIEGSLVRWAVPTVLAYAVFGLVRLFRARGPGRAVLAASLVSVALVGALRLSVPAVFGHVHLALFVTPLLCVAAAAGLDLLIDRGRIARALAAVLAGGVVVHGLVIQAQLFLIQLGRAR